MNKILNKIYESAIVYKKIQLKRDVVLILNYLKTSSNRLKEKRNRPDFSYKICRLPVDQTCFSFAAAGIFCAITPTSLWGT